MTDHRQPTAFVRQNQLKSPYDPNGRVLAERVTLRPEEIDYIIELCDMADHILKPRPNIDWDVIKSKLLANRPR